VVGCIGSLRCQPALEWLVESVAAARARGAEVEILFAGTGTARPYVERAAAERPFVRLLGPYDYSTEIRALYEQIDAAFAVYEETWDKRTHLACRLSDAVASNRSIIVAGGTYMAELVERHRLGYAVDINRPDSLTDVLMEAARDRDHWRNPARVPSRVREEHLFDTYVPALIDIYRAALGRRMGPSSPANGNVPRA
jgi:hypothetical protein